MKMSKFYNVIKEESDRLYDAYIRDAKNEELLSRFTIVYTLQNRCEGKSDFEIVLEYLMLKNDLKRELEEALEIFGNNDSSTVDRLSKLVELDKIAFFLKKI